MSTYLSDNAMLESSKSGTLAEPKAKSSTLAEPQAQGSTLAKSKAKKEEDNYAVTWDTLYFQNDNGKLSLNGQGKVTLKNNDDGQANKVEDDGTVAVDSNKVKIALDWVTSLPEKHPADWRDAAEAALKTKNLTLVKLYEGVKVSVVLGAVYCLHVEAKQTHGTGNFTGNFFTVVYDSFLTKDKQLGLFLKQLPEDDE